MRILIVDDSKAMRMIVARTVRQAGYGSSTLEEAVNGAEALKQVKANMPDLILCDWNMPEMNGIDLLRTLRNENINVPFGFVTSEGTVEMRHTAMEAGARFLITKPFTIESFQDALELVKQ